MKVIPLFGNSISAYSAAVSAQRRLNVFAEVRKDNDKHNIILRGTPGLSLLFTLPSAPIRGWRVVGSLLYIVAGSVLYSRDSTGTVMALGTMTNSASGLVSMQDNGVQLGIADGVSLWCYTIVTGSYSQSSLNAAGSFGSVTDANFPNGSLSLAFLDGFLIAVRPNSRQHYVSNNLDITAWTSVSSIPTFFTKQNSSDNSVANDVLNGTIILWGAQSIEFWQDVGTFPLPFARINGASQTWGLAAVNSRAFLNNTMIFLGHNPQGGIQVVMLEGYSPKRVSTSDVENIFSSLPVVSDAVSMSYVIDGHPMYQTTFPSANRSFLYDTLSDMWSEVQTGLDLQSRHIANLSVTFGVSDLVSDSTTGNVYLLTDTAYTDNGTPIKRQVVTRHVTNDGNDFGISELLFDMETGVGLQAGQGMSPQVMLQSSKDDGRTWGPERYASLGAVGQYRSPRVIFRRLGRGRDFVFRLTMTDPVKFTLVRGAATLAQGEGSGG